MNIPWYFVPPFLPIDINLLNFINDLFSKFSRILNEPSSSTSSRPIIDSKKCINHFILMFLLGWNFLLLYELYIDSEEQGTIKRGQNKLLTKGISESSVPYIMGFTVFPTNTVPLISSTHWNYYLICIVKYQSQPRTSYW